jgi:hypothetical protein
VPARFGQKIQEMLWDERLSRLAFCRRLPFSGRGEDCLEPAAQKIGLVFPLFIDPDQGLALFWGIIRVLGELVRGLLNLSGVDFIGLMTAVSPLAICVSRSGHLPYCHGGRPATIGLAADRVGSGIGKTRWRSEGGNRATAVAATGVIHDL